MHIKNRMTALFHPEQYHGWGKTKRYFEGWYYKIVDAKENYAFAFIPGIAMDETGQQQSFIQVLDGKQLKAAYHKFEASDFKPSSGQFKLDLAGNNFSPSGFSVDLPGVKGELKFKNQVPWPSTWNSPGIMGPFSFVPMMECYHGILSMDHDISGTLEIEGKTIDFTGGKGYMEKDWGVLFRKAIFGCKAIILVRLELV